MSPRNKNKGAHGHPHKQSNSLVGNIPELKSNVFDYGTGSQSDRFGKIQENIANHMGVKYGKPMKDLVMGKENPPTEPRMPNRPAEGKAPSPYAMEKYGKAMSHYFVKLDKYEDNKGRVFIEIRGQCTLAMNNKLESLPEFETWEDESDVAKLMKAIKDLSYDTKEVQYPFWTAVVSWRRMAFLHQYAYEDYPAYYKRFKTNRDLMTPYWGTKWLPTELIREDLPEDQAIQRFEACVFLAGVSKQKSGNLLDELNNAYLKGIDNYPTTVESAMKMLSLRADSKHKKKPPASINLTPKAPESDDDSHDDDSASTASSFSQSYNDKKYARASWSYKGKAKGNRRKRTEVSSMILAERERNAFLDE